MSILRRRHVSLTALRLAALAALACAGSETAPGGAILAGDLRARLLQLEVGQSEAQAHAILGRDPVARPGRPDAPFASPLRALELVTPHGERVRVELYVVTAHPAEGCPDVFVRAEPVVFVDGAVAALGWEAVESAWRDWGGTLEALRAARGASGCPGPPA